MAISNRAEQAMKVLIKNINYMGRSGGQVVSVLVFYSDNPSSNPADTYSFSVKIVFEKEQT